MAQFHFVEDYEKHVAKLLTAYPLDKAMSLAVGGDYERIGKIAADIMIHAGASDGMSVLDFGCGSGRVASALSKQIEIRRYLGTDVVQSLLNYAATKTPKHFEFVRHRKLSIPAHNGVFDIAYAFSVFTHLLQTEIFIYLVDIARVLKPGGTFVFSFLEFEMDFQWSVFAASVEQQRRSTLPHLNMFTDRSQIKAWAKNAGFAIAEFIDGNTAIGSAPLGQSVAILNKL